jgi:small subunit ribosomal protein S19
MARSLKKGPFVAHHLLNQIEAITGDSKKTIITWSRGSIVVPVIIGKTISVYNGRDHLPILITDQIVGHKLGEFSPTRHFNGHIKSDTKTKRLLIFSAFYGTKDSPHWYSFGY